MSIVREVRPVTAFIGGNEGIVELLDQWRAVDTAQSQLFEDLSLDLDCLGGGDDLRERLREVERELLDVRRTLEAEREKLAAVRAGRDKLYEDYCGLARRFEPANVEEQE